MKDINNLKQYIDTNMENIEITEEIKNNVIRKSKNNKKYNFKHIAIITTAMLLIICLSFSNQISHASQSILKYLPGLNKLFYENTEHQIYGLLGSVEVGMGDKYIKVNSAYNESNTITMTLEGNVPIGTEIDEYISVIDEHGKNAELASYDIIIDDDNFKWSLRATYTFDNIVNNYNIIYDEFNIPIIMSELPEVLPKERNYIHIGDIGTDIAVLSDYVEERLEIILLAQANDLTKSIYFPLKDIYLLNSKGEKYYPSDSKLDNTLYFNERLEPGIRLVIPYILITDNDIQSKITITKKDETPINLPIGDYNITIDTVEWAQYIEDLNFRTPENDYCHIVENAQKVKLLINKNIDKTDEIDLYDISAEVDKNELNEYKVEGIKFIYYDPEQETNSNIVNENYKELTLSSLKEEQQEINITFSEPIFCSNNSIIIPLQP